MYYDFKHTPFIHSPFIFFFPLSLYIYCWLTQNDDREFVEGVLCIVPYHIPCILSFPYIHIITYIRNQDIGTYVHPYIHTNLRENKKRKKNLSPSCLYFMCVVSVVFTNMYFS